MSEVISFRLFNENQAKLNFLLKKTKKERTFIINDAISNYNNDIKHILARKIYLLEKELNYYKSLLSDWSDNE